MDTPATLLEEIASTDFLKKAWTSLNKANQNSSGLSNISIKNFEVNLDANIKIISGQLLAGKYSFSSVKAVTISKSNGNGLRPLRIGEIKDRLLHKALAIKLDAVLTDRFHLNNECSFAYRKKKNVRNAIEKMVEYYNLGFKIILEADIKKFFDTVDKGDLLQKIQEVLPDKSINGLLVSAMSQQIGNKESFSSELYEEYFSNSENGIPQGNALSPLFANIYLADFDARIISENLKMIRYADDFIIMCKTREEAEKALIIAKDELETKLSLQLHELGHPNDENAKTRILNPTMNKFSFLSIRFDGTRCWVKDKKVLSIIYRIQEITNVQVGSNLLATLNSLKNTVEGWIAAYHFVDLNKHLLEIDKQINRNLYLALVKLGLELKPSSLEKIFLQRISEKDTDKEKKEKYFVENRFNEVKALNSKQRNSIGIPNSIVVWKRMTTEKITTKRIIKKTDEIIDHPKKDV